MAWYGVNYVLAAGLHKTVSILRLPNEHLVYGGGQLAVGFLVTFVTGYYSIRLLLKIVGRFGLLPFIVYRILLAIVILIYFPR